MEEDWMSKQAHLEDTDEQQKDLRIGSEDVEQDVTDGVDEAPMDEGDE